MNTSLQYFANVKGILDGSFASSPRRRRAWWWMIALNVLAIGRGVIILYASLGDDDHNHHLIAWQLDVDLLRSTWPKCTFQLALVCFICLFIFTVYLIRFFYHGVCLDHHVNPFVADLSVVNTEDVFHQNRARFDRLLTLKNAHWGRDLVHLLRDLVLPKKSPRERRLTFRQRLTNVPITNVTVRGRLFLIVAFNEILTKFALISGTILFLYLAHQCFLYVWHNYSIVWFAYCLVDYIWFAILCLDFLGMGFLTVGIVNTTQFGLHQTLALINKQYAKIAAYVRRTQPKAEIRTQPKAEALMRPKAEVRTSPRAETSFVRRVRWAVRAQKCMLEYILYNDRVWGRLFAVFLLTNAPINVLLVFLIFFKSVPNQQLFALLFYSQTIGTLLTIIPMVLNNLLLHNPAKHFVSIQAKLANSIRDKWKWNARYELIHSQQGIGYTVVPFGVITMRVLLQILIVYNGFLFFLVKMMRRLE